MEGDPKETRNNESNNFVGFVNVSSSGEEGGACPSGELETCQLNPARRRQLQPTIRCRPGLLHSLICSLSKRQKKWIKLARWGHILRMDEVCVERRFCAWLTQRFDPNTQTLIMRTDRESEDGMVKSVPINEQLVAWVFGLPNGRDLHSLPPKACDRKELTRLRLEYNRGGDIQSNHVWNLAVGEKKDRCAFLRHFFLFVLGSTLCTTQSNWFSPALLKMITSDVMRQPGKFNWAGYVLDWIVKYSIKPTSKGWNVSGSPLLLLIAYLDRLNMGKGQNWRFDRPRIAAWNKKSIMRAIKADTFEDGRYGRASIVEGVEYGKLYPVQATDESENELYISSGGSSCDEADVNNFKPTMVARPPQSSWTEKATSYEGNTSPSADDSLMRVCGSSEDMDMGLYAASLKRRRRLNGSSALRHKHSAPGRYHHSHRASKLKEIPSSEDDGWSEEEADMSEDGCAPMQDDLQHSDDGRSFARNERDEGKGKRPMPRMGMTEACRNIVPESSLSLRVQTLTTLLENLDDKAYHAILGRLLREKIAGRIP